MDCELPEERKRIETDVQPTEAVKSRPMIIQLLHGKLESETGAVEIPLENTSLLLRQKASRSTQTGPPVHFGASYNRCLSRQEPGTLWADGRWIKRSHMPGIRMPRNARHDADATTDAVKGSVLKDAIMPQFVDVCETPLLRMKRTTLQAKNEDDVEQTKDVVSKEDSAKLETLKTTLSIRRNNSYTSFAVEKYRLKAANDQPPTAPPSESRRYYNNFNSIRQMTVPQLATGKLNLEITELDRQLERVRLECQGTGELDCEDRVPEKPRVVPRMGTRLCVDRLRGRNGLGVSHETDCTLQHTQFQIDDPRNFHHSSDGTEGENAAGDTSTSAYNTGDSSCSTPLTAIDPTELERRLIENANRSNDSSFKSETFSLQNIEQNLTISTIWPKITSAVYDLKEPDSNNPRDHVTVSANRERCCDHATIASNQNRCRRHVSNKATGDLNAVYVDVMYTNMANLDHTIMVQQRLFDRQLRLKGRSPQETLESAGELQKPASLEKSHTQLDDVKPSDFEKSPGRKLDHPMEWVVKRRSDGTRYITRRPGTGFQSKKPQKRLKEHPRNMLSSEEDETAGEVKMGRNWSREERRRHRRLSKEKSLRQEETSGQGNIEDGSCVVQLQRLPNRCRKRLDPSGQVLHLSSGRRDVLKRLHNPLLSVTTI